MILIYLERPFPSRSSISQWHSTPTWNGIRQISLLYGGCGWVLPRCCSIWRRLVLRIFIRWRRQLRCWNDASEFFFFFVPLFEGRCLMNVQQLLGECFSVLSSVTPWKLFFFKAKANRINLLISYRIWKCYLPSIMGGGGVILNKSQIIALECCQDKHWDLRDWQNRKLSW